MFLVLLCISCHSVQTCSVGQVVVNGVCTYDDPALKIWYTFDLDDPHKNSVSLGTIENVRQNLLFAPVITTNTTAVRGNASHILANRAIYIHQDSYPPWGCGNTLTFSWWIYATINYQVHLCVSSDPRRVGGSRGEMTIISLEELRAPLITQQSLEDQTV